MPPLHHPLLLPAAFLVATAIAALVLAIGRDAGRKRRLNPLLFGAVAVVISALWVMAGREAAGALVVLPAVAAMVGVARTTRFCDACGVTIFPRSFATVRQCPSCKDDLRAQASARAAGIARDARLARGA
jgi:predicted RNA-binding Zn-ribbon protein involved in translation (DUF1610 family)